MNINSNCYDKINLIDNLLSILIELQKSGYK